LSLQNNQDDESNTRVLFFRHPAAFAVCHTVDHGHQRHSSETAEKDINFAVAAGSHHRAVDLFPDQAPQVRIFGRLVARLFPGNQPSVCQL